MSLLPELRSELFDSELRTLNRLTNEPRWGCARSVPSRRNPRSTFPPGWACLLSWHNSLAQQPNLAKPAPFPRQEREVAQVGVNLVVAAVHLGPRTSGGNGKIWAITSWGDNAAWFLRWTGPELG